MTQKPDNPKATIKSDNTQALYNALEIIQQQRDVMRMAREALAEGKHYTFLAEHCQDESNFPELTDNAIAALDAALNK